MNSLGVLCSNVAGIDCKTKWLEGNTENKRKYKNDRHWFTKCILRYEGKMKNRVFPAMWMEGGIVPCFTES